VLRDLVGALVLAGTLWVLWQLGVLRTTLSHAVDTPMQRKMQEADRVVHYRFDHDGGPTFHLDGDELELRLVTHLFLEPGRIYSAQDTYDYGLRLHIEDPSGRTIWKRDIYTSTRQSKDRWVDGHWMQENAFSLEPGVEITDDRVHLVTLPHDVPWGSRFYTRLEAPAAAFGVMRAYERVREGSSGLSLDYLEPTPAEEARMVGRLTYLPWDALSADQRLARLQPRWGRMSALGEAGSDYEVETVFYTGFRAPPIELPPPPSTILVDDRATALTAWGPGELRLWVHAECPPSLGDDVPRPWVELLHLDTAGIVDGRSLDPCGGATVELWLPEGPHTVHLRGHDLPETTVDAWYDDHREAPLATAGFELGRPLLPTIARTPQIRLRTGGAAADYALFAPEDLESAMIQLQARLPVAPRSDPAAQRAATVRYTFVDPLGKPLEQGQWQLEPTAQLEAYEHVVDAADATQQQWVSASLSTRFIAPEGTARLWLESEGEVIVAVYVYWPGTSEPPHPHPPYDEVMLEGTRWRQVAVDYARWFRLTPHNAHILQRHGQTVDLQGPVRLELIGGLDGDSLPRLADVAESTEIPEGTSSWVSLFPYTRHEQRTVLERTTPGSPLARFARWEPGKATLEVDDGWGATLLYLVDGPPEAALGQAIVVTLDGQPLAYTLASTRGSLKLPEFDPGSHALELGPLPPGVRVYIDRPELAPASGQPAVYQVITLHRLQGRTMGLALDTAGEEREYVNAIAMACDEHEPNRIRIVLDGGSPRRRVGTPIDRVTKAIRQQQLAGRGEPIEVVFLDRPQAHCEALGRMSIPLGPDLSAGPHRIALRVEDGPGVWIRFFRRGTEQARPERTAEWTERLLDLDAGDRAP
jgi:hypothetical protein